MEHVRPFFRHQSISGFISSGEIERFSNEGWEQEARNGILFPMFLVPRGDRLGVEQGNRGSISALFQSQKDDFRSMTGQSRYFFFNLGNLTCPKIDEDE